MTEFLFKGTVHPKKFKFCIHLLILMLFLNCMICFLLWNPCPQKTLYFLATCVIVLNLLFPPQQPLVFILIILTHFTSSCSFAHCDTDRLTCNRGLIWFIPMSSDQITSKNCSPAMSPQLSCSPQLGFFPPEAEGSWVSCLALSYDRTQNEHRWDLFAGLGVIWMSESTLKL